MLHASTLEFLHDLKAHNNKEWFDENRDRYQTARENVIQLVDQILEEVAAFDPNVRGLEARKCLFRINRDIRFSANKDPYKTNFGASMAKGGRRSSSAGYYIHIQPDQVFVGGGIWMPPSAQLKQIRSHIDRNAPDLREILAEEAFQSYYGELHGESLKTAPKGYERDHPAIDLLRMKSFTAMRRFTDQEALQEGFLTNVVEGFETLHPLLGFLNSSSDTDQ